MIRSLRIIILVLVALALAGGSACAQRSWIVDRCNGPLADFTDLPAAVAAAAPGDTLWLYRGCASSPSFTACHIDKPLRLIAMGWYASNAPGTSPQGPRVSVKGRITVSNIAAGQRLVLSGVSLFFDHGTYPNLVLQPHGIHAWDCAGQVILENVWWVTGGVIQGRCRFERCADVIIRGCFLYCRSEPITFVDSSAYVHYSQLLSENGIYGLSSWYPISWYGLSSPSQPAVLIRNSNVFASDAAILGADARDNPQPTAGSDGAVVESGSLVLAGGTFIQGGWPMRLHGGFPYRPADGRGLVFRDPRSGALPASFQFTPINVNTVTFRWLVQNQTYDVEVFGPPGGFALLAVGSYLQQPIRGPLGDLGIDPSGIAVIGAAALDSTYGWAQWRLPLGWQVPVEHVFAFQAGLLDPSGGISLSHAAPFLVGWGVGRQP